MSSGAHSPSLSISIDGVPVDRREATISVLDRGFLYGDSVFEVLRSYEGFPYALGAHLDRLSRSAKRVGITLPVSEGQLAEEIRDLLRSSGLRDAYVRVIITRGQGPLTYDPTTAENPRRVIMAGMLPTTLDALRERGAAIELIATGRTASFSSLAEAKASNYLANLLAVRKANDLGADEAVFVGQAGEVLEGASSNVFIVRGGIVSTPAARGILSGVTRAAVLQVAAERFGLPVEGLLFPHDLYGADEVFITSSIREVVPVVRVDGLTIGDGTPGRVTRALMDELHRWAIRESAREAETVR